LVTGINISGGDTTVSLTTIGTLSRSLHPSYLTSITISGSDSTRSLHPSYLPSITISGGDTRILHPSYLTSIIISGGDTSVIAAISARTDNSVTVDGALNSDNWAGNSIRQ
jgi:hypothetical protein